MENKKKKKFQLEDIPSSELISEELKRVKYKSKYRNVLKSTVYSLLVVAAIAVLVATIWLPVLRIYGGSMTPTLHEGEIVISFKGSDFKKGNIVGLYVGNKLLVKRIIAGPGQWVNIEQDGTVYVDGQRLDEPYLTEKAYGDVNIELPYQVPDKRYFVMGDHRSTSADSRNTAVGCVAEEQIVGRIVFRVWPLNKFGVINEKLSNQSEGQSTGETTQETKEQIQGGTQEATTKQTTVETTDQTVAPTDQTTAPTEQQPKQTIQQISEGAPNQIPGIITAPSGATPGIN